MTEIQDTAPDFTLPITGADPLSLSSLRGSPVVLFFYPRDDTSGCTKEAIAFSELKETFDAMGVHVLGISKDSMKSHDKFVAKHALTVPLLSDEEGDVCERYGVWKEKNMYGKKFMGIERSTYLIDASGQIAQIWRKVKVPGHAEAILEAVKSL